MKRDPNYPFPGLAETNRLRARLGTLSQPELLRLIRLEEAQEGMQRDAEKRAREAGARAERRRVAAAIDRMKA